MLIIALVLAVIGLASLVAAVVTSNELIAWVCIGASVIGVVLLIVDALRDRSRRQAGDTDDEPAAEPDEPETAVVQDYPDDEPAESPEIESPEFESPDTESPETGAADEPPAATETAAETEDNSAEHKS